VWKLLWSFSIPTSERMTANLSAIIASLRHVLANIQALARWWLDGVELAAVFDRRVRA
jgi:uncharacterized membrane protein